MFSLTIQVAHVTKLKNIARLMVDIGFSDRKEQIITLHRLGLKQPEIARRLEIERLAVSKALYSITDCFRLSIERMRQAAKLYPLDQTLALDLTSLSRG